MALQPHSLDSSEQRDEILALLRSGHTIQDLADQYNISWNVLKDMINTGVLKPGDSPKGKKRHRLKPSRLSQMNEAVYQWYRLQRSMNVCVSSAQLCIKALFFHSKIRVNNQFNASRGWLSRFRDRHSITLDKTDGGESEMEAMRIFVNRISSTFLTDKDMSEAQIYSVDECVLLWNDPPIILPGQTISDRMSLVTCTNMEGTHKLGLQTVGAYKEVEQSEVDYTFLDQGYITKEWFSDWFHTKFVREVEKSLQERGLPRCAILVVDNSSCHPNVSSLRDGDICAVTLPCQISNRIVPAAIVATCLKLQYRRLFLKQWHANAITTMKKASDMLSNSWRLLSEEKVRACWSSFRVDVGVSDVLNIDELVMKGLTTEQVMFWITKDRRPSYVPFRVPSDTDIITAAQAMTRNVQNAPPPLLVPEEDRYSASMLDNMKRESPEEGIVKRQKLATWLAHKMSDGPMTPASQHAESPAVHSMTLRADGSVPAATSDSVLQNDNGSNGSVTQNGSNSSVAQHGSNGSVAQNASYGSVAQHAGGSSCSVAQNISNNTAPLLTNLTLIDKFFETLQKKMSCASYTGDKAQENIDQNINRVSEIKPTPNHIWRPKLELTTEPPDLTSSSSEACSMRPVINIPSQYTTTNNTSNSKAVVSKEDAIAGLEKFISYVDRQPSVTPILKDVIYEYKRFVEMKL